MIETIRDFAEQRRVRQWDHSTAARVQEEYQTSGYYPIQASSWALWQWGELHEWCCEHIGRDHYIWTGSTFWFENQRDAMWFALRWA